MKDLKEEKGFTLAELLLVIALIAILVAIMFPIFSNTTGKAQEKACIANRKAKMSEMNMRLAMGGAGLVESHYGKNGSKLDASGICASNGTLTWKFTYDKKGREDGVVIYCSKHKDIEGDHETERPDPTPTPTPTPIPTPEPTPTSYPIPTPDPGYDPTPDPRPTPTPVPTPTPAPSGLAIMGTDGKNYYVNAPTFKESTTVTWLSETECYVYPGMVIREGNDYYVCMYQSTYIGGITKDATVAQLNQKTGNGFLKLNGKTARTYEVDTTITEGQLTLSYIPQYGELMVWNDGKIYVAGWGISIWIRPGEDNNWKPLLME